MSVHERGAQQRAISVSSLQDRKPNHYLVSEIFYSVQGEGVRAGTPMVFVRFAQCNLRCSVANAGFDCDTDFVSHREMALDHLVEEVALLNPPKGWLLFTGGEPGLQVDTPLIERLHAAGWKLAIETNGTIRLPEGIDWICVSPKSADHTIRQRIAHEVKYVRAQGMAVPSSGIKAEHYLVSPAFQADGSIRLEDLQWCVDLVKQHPQQWRLTVQYHKFLKVR